MLNSLCSILISLSLLAPQSVSVDNAYDNEKQLPQGVIVVSDVNCDANFDINVNEVYNKLKAELDANFSNMFELEKELNNLRNQTNACLSEYKALKRAYDIRLNAIIDFIAKLNEVDFSAIPKPINIHPKAYEIK